MKSIKTAKVDNLEVLHVDRVDIYKIEAMLSISTVMNLWITFKKGDSEFTPCFLNFIGSSDSKNHVYDKISIKSDKIKSY